MAGSIEYRFARDLRSDGRTLFGLAAPYGQAAQIGGFSETINRGAFGRTLRDGADVMLLRDHDPTQLLARTSNGSLALQDGADGLHFRAELAQFTTADDTLSMVRAGLLAGMSIGFYVRAERWDNGQTQRTLDDIELVEISAVQAAVAYPGTAIAARSRSLSSEIARRRRRRALMGL